MILSRTIARALCIVLLFGVHCLRAPAEAFTDAVRAYLQQRVDAQTIPFGIVVGLVDERGSQIISYGKLDNDTDVEVNGDTVFEIGSVTKTFTGLLLQDMIDRGQMNLDDPAAKYLPEKVKLPTHNGKEITLRHLATHASGLPRDADNYDPTRADNPYADWTEEKLYEFLSRHKLARDPGAEWDYSNVGLGLLGQILARKAGTNYEALVVDRICRPLKMDSTRITLSPELQARFAQGHNELGYRARSEDFAVPGAGALRSTANDLIKYVSANLGTTPSSLTPLMRKTHAVHFAHARPTYEMGLAWWLILYRGGTIVWHGGGLSGAIASVGFDTSRRRGVVILSNMRNGFDLFSLGNFLLECEWQTERRPSEAKMGGGNFDSYVGQYARSSGLGLETASLRQRLQNTPRPIIYIPIGLGLVTFFLRRVGRLRKRMIILGVGGVATACLAMFGGRGANTGGAATTPEVRVEIGRQGERLFAQARGQTDWVNPFPPDSFELVAEPGGHFFERLSGMTLTFARDKAGKVTGFTCVSGGAAPCYRKISDRQPEASKPPRPRMAIKLEAKLLDACVGRYVFPSNQVFPGGLIANIWREGDRLAGSVSGSNTLRGAFEIYPESETEFFLPLDGARLAFIKSAKGEVTGVVRRKDGQADLEGKKMRVSGD